MYVLWPIAVLSLFAPATLAQHNITVNDTDPSIQYQGGAGDALICKVNPDGTFVGGQPGCYSVPSNCTQSVAMGQKKESAASFNFQGSAIYINSLLFGLSPLYTVTLDGTATDVDGVRSSGTFLCETLFSRTGLDPTVNHTISLSIKSQSPNRTTTTPSSDNIFDFSLINFIYTIDDSTTSSNSSSTSSNSTTTSSNGTTTASNGTQSPANDTKSSSSTSIQVASSGIHTIGLGSLLVLLTTVMSVHWP